MRFYIARGDLSPSYCIIIFQCSVTCGSGTQTRDVICPAPTDPPGEFECTDEKPETSRACEKDACVSNSKYKRKNLFNCCGLTFDLELVTFRLLPGTYH